LMAKHKPRRQQGRRAQPKDTPAVTLAKLGVAEEIERVIDTPLAQLLFGPEEKAMAEELTRQAVSAPAMARMRAVVEFVGNGRPATKAGNLKLADALSLAERLGTGARVLVDRAPVDRAPVDRAPVDRAPVDRAPVEMRSMDDLPETAHAFRWAVAAGFLARRGNQIVPGPSAREFERDPLAAWFMAAITLLEHGPLDGFRQGWRKSYVEFLDAAVTSLLAAIAEAGGRAPIADIEENAWEQVADAYGYQLGDDKERRHVVTLVGGLVGQLADVGVMAREDDEAVLTGLGVLLASVASLADLGELDDDELDLVDTDAQSLLLVCAEEMEPAEASEHLLAWCRARPGGEAADELCEAMLDDDNPRVWGLGFEALGMIDPAVAGAAVRELRSDNRLRPRADAWLRSRPPMPPR
jgi:hypothetical protein